MALKVGELYGELGLNSAPFTAGLAKAEAQTTASGLKMGAVMGVAMMASQMAFNMILKGVSDVAGEIMSSVDAARQMEVAQAKLDQALRTSGSSYAANAVAIEEVVKKGVDLGFTDDKIIDGMARLVSATGSVSKASYAMGIAQDLARLKGISLESATDALTKIEGGRFRALASLGIVLQDGATIEDALTAVRARASGQAESFAKTETGAWDRVAAKWDQTKEKLGNMIIPALTDLANVMADDVVPAISGIIDAFGKAGPVLVGVGTAAALVLVPALWGVALALGGIVVAALPILLPFAAVAAVVALVAANLDFLAKLFSPVTDALGQMADGVRFLLGPFAGLNDFLFNKTPEAAAATTTAAEDVDAALQRLAKQATESYVSVGGAAEAAGYKVGTAAFDMTTAATKEGIAIRASAEKDAESYVSVGGAAEAAGFKVGTAAFESSTAATKAASVIYTAMADIGTSFKSAANAAIAAVNAEIAGAYDPQITAAELVVARLALTDDKKKLSAKGVTTEVKAQLNLQIINDRMHIATLEAQQLAYGTKAQQIAKINGFLTGKAHADALKSTNPQEKEAADTLDTTLRAVLLKLQGEAASFGTKTGAAYAGGLASALVNGKRVVVDAIHQIRGVIYATSPPGPESPLHEIDKWGARTGQSWVDNLVGSITGGKDGILGALGGLAMPGVAGVGLQSMSVAGQAVGGVASHVGSGAGGVPGVGVTVGHISVAVNAGDGNLKTARRFGQEVADTIASTLREQMARTGGT